MRIFGKSRDRPQQSTVQYNTSKESKYIQPLETKASKANPVFAENINEVNTDGFLTAYKNADLVFSCVGYVADIASQIEFKLFTKKADKKTPYKNDKVNKWLKQPNDFQPMSELVHLYMQSYLLAGNSYMTFEKVGSKFESWVLDPTLVKIVPDRKKYIQGYLFNDQVAFKQDEIFFFRNPILKDEYYGLSFLAALVDPLDIEGYSIDDLKSFYKNSLIAQGIFTSEYPLSQKQVDALRAQFNALYGLRGNSRHGHIIAPNNLKYQPLRINPKDGMLLDALRISEERVYKVFRLNPALLGVGYGDVNGTELKEMKKIFVNNFIRPIIYRLTKTWELHLKRILKDENLVLEADYSSIPEISEALEEKIDAVKQAVSIGLMSYNEGRDRVGLEPIESGLMDAHFAPSFLTGATPINLVTGEQVNFGATNQQPKPQGSTNPEGGNPDGVSR